MRTEKTVEWDGKEYNINDLIKIAAEKYNNELNAAQINHRINYGWSGERILGTPVKKKASPKKFLYKGEECTPAQLATIAKEDFDNEIKAGTIFRRLTSGWDVETALKKPHRHYHKLTPTRLKKQQQAARARYVAKNPEKIQALQRFYNSRQFIKEFATEQELKELIPLLEDKLVGKNIPNKHFNVSSSDDSKKRRLTNQINNFLKLPAKQDQVTRVLDTAKEKLNGYR